MNVVVLLGAPGAGKGTQAPLLAARLGIPVVATGDLFRAAVRDGTPLGLEARRYMDAGQLVPDEITVRLLLERLTRPDAAAGVILDGFPRTGVQAGALDAALAERGAPGVGAAVLVDVPPEELVRRMSGRWVCRAAGPSLPRESPARRTSPGICDLDGSELYQRPDDRPETIRVAHGPAAGRARRGHRALPDLRRPADRRRPAAHRRRGRATSTLALRRPGSPSGRRPGRAG